MRIITILVASLILSASLCLAGGPVNLSSPEARALLAKNSRIVLLDVRTPDEYRQAHLRGALLIPLDELERRLPEIPRDRPLLVYCAVGARSLTAARLLAAKGFREVYQLSDGLVGWYKNGYPVERAR